jgi:hypothetical protein
MFPFGVGSGTVFEICEHQSPAKPAHTGERSAAEIFELRTSGQATAYMTRAHECVRPSCMDLSGPSKLGRS